MTKTKGRTPVIPIRRSVSPAADFSGACPQASAIKGCYQGLGSWVQPPPPAVLWRRKEVPPPPGRLRPVTAAQRLLPGTGGSEAGVGTSCRTAVPSAGRGAGAVSVRLCPEPRALWRQQVRLRDTARGERVFGGARRPRGSHRPWLRCPCVRSTDRAPESDFHSPSEAPLLQNKSEEPQS